MDVAVDSLRRRLSSNRTIANMSSSATPPMIPPTIAPLNGMLSSHLIVLKVEAPALAL